MSNYEPTKAYIYQPEPVYNKDGTENKNIYALAGPRTWAFNGLRFTKEEAETILKLLSIIEIQREALEDCDAEITSCGAHRELVTTAKEALTAVEKILGAG